MIPNDWSDRKGYLRAISGRKHPCLIEQGITVIFLAPLTALSAVLGREILDGSAELMGVKKTGKGRRKIGSAKRKNRSKIRHRK